MNTAPRALDTLLPGRTAPPRASRRFIALYGLATFGFWMAVMTPVIVTMALKVNQLAPDSKESTLAWVLGIGAFVAMIANPVAGLFSDRTRSRFGMRRPWLVGGALLGLAGSASQQGLSLASVLSLPLLFASGMTLLDTLDGAAMTHAYAWALEHPRARRGYNLIVTGLSGGLALVIGAVTLAGWVGAHFTALGAWLAPLGTLDTSTLGYWLSGIVLGLFVYAILVAQMKHFSGWAGTMALSLIAIPVVVRTTENMLRLVPGSLREAAFGLGAPRWKVATFVTLRAARAGVMTGLLLALARISGETAPLLFTALNNQFFSTNMNAPMANLPVVIFQFAMSPYDNWVRLAWGGALLITLTVLILNIVARVFFRDNAQR